MTVDRCLTCASSFEGLGTFLTALSELEQQGGRLSLTEVLVQKPTTLQEGARFRSDDPFAEEEEEEGVISVSQMSTVEPRTLEFYRCHFINSRPHIFIRSVHPSIARELLEDVCRTILDFCALHLSKPSASRRWHKTAWVTFEKKDGAGATICHDHELADADWMGEKWKALDGLVINHFELHANLFKRVPEEPRIAHTAFSEEQRLRHDLGVTVRSIDILSTIYRALLPPFLDEWKLEADALGDDIVATRLDTAILICEASSSSATIVPQNMRTCSS
jgi:hypothetical protein